MNFTNVKGTEVKVGDRLVRGFGPNGLVEVTSATYGQLPAGAKFADVVLTNGNQERLWEGFLTRVAR